MMRFDLLSLLIERKCYQSYLEIGCQTDATFGRIRLTDKVGVDPVSGGTVRATSDEYFATCDRLFDLIFIDGDHRAEQVERDMLNSLLHLAPGGAMVLHDCLPETEQQTIWPGDASGSYTGDAWKIVASYRMDADLDIATGHFDWGCAVIFPRANRTRLPLTLDGKWWHLAWVDYQAQRDSLLNVVNVAQMHAFIDREAFG